MNTIQHERLRACVTAYNLENHGNVIGWSNAVENDIHTFITADSKFSSRTLSFFRLLEVAKVYEMRKLNHL